MVSVPRCTKEPELAKRINVEGTRNLLRIAADSKVERFVFASSAAVYGNSQDLPLKADSQTGPISVYGESKLEAEKLCLEMHRQTGLGTTVLRYFNVYGPRSLGGEYGSVINKFMQRLEKMKSPIINGDGSATRDFIYAKDVARANVLAASNRVSSGKVYNVASGKRTTISEVADLEMRLILGKNLVLPLEYRPASKEDILHSYADVTAIREELGFEARYSLEEGLTEYFKTMFPSLPLSWQSAECG